MPDARVAGFETIRYLPIQNPASVQETVTRAFMTETDDNYDVGADGSHIYSYLSISGGGSDGAFSAGLLNGWTEKGDRPRFKIVTGVSTGSLIAPLAFLGPEYDQEMKEAYTTVGAEHIFILHDLITLPWQDALADTQPLQDLVATYVDDAMLDRIAVEHAKGRRLYVATTNLDEEQPVIWDMGAIASSKAPDRLVLFRKVLVASASIPAFFPPTMLSVELDGKKYDEMHVDGGVFFQAFAIAAFADLRTLTRQAHADFSGTITQRLYVIRNGRTGPEPKPVARSLGGISSQAINTMIKVSGVNDLFRLYLASLSDDMEFRYVMIPDEYVPLSTEEFNKDEMNQQFNLGRKMALDGIPWRTTPPYFVPDPAP